MGRIANFLLGGQRAEFSLASASIDQQLLEYMNQSKLNASVVAAIYRARLMTADALGSVPVLVDGVPWRGPSPEQTAQDFVSETVLSMMDYGDAYWRVSAERRLRVLNFTDMAVRWTDVDRAVREYHYRTRRMFVGTNLRVLSMDRGPEDLTGHGPMQSDRVKGLIAETVYAQEYYLNNGAPTGILKLPTVGNAQEAEELKKAFLANQKARNPAVLAGGIEWERTGFSASDSQWVEAHRAGVGDAALLFGVPGSLLEYNQGTSMTYENIGEVHERWWKQTLFPSYAKRVEDQLSVVLNGEVRFDPEQFFLASLTSRSTAAQQLTTTGYDPAAVLDAVGLPRMQFVGFDSGEEQPNV